MKAKAKIICCGLALAWMQGVGAEEVTVSEQGDAIVLESLGSSADTAQAASAPADVPDMAPPAQTHPVQDGQPVMKAPVQPYYEKVDRARIEKRMADRAARTKKRSLEAEKDATERAAKAKANQTTQQGPDTQNSQ